MVENAREHPVFSRLSVTQDVNIGSYIGVPIRYADGTIVGTLCGIDPDPRTFDRTEIHFLQVLARSVAALLERRAGVPNRSNGINLRGLQEAQLNLENIIAQTRSQLTTRQNETVLLIDTTITMRQPIAGTLRKNGYRPVEMFKLPNIETFRDDLERIKPRLVIIVESDNSQQDLDIIRHIRQNPRYLNLPVLYLTHQRINQVNGYTAGATRCLLYTANIEIFLQDLRDVAV